MKGIPGVPAVVQWDQWYLGSSGMQVQSRARHSGLRIQRCCRCGWNLIPGLGTPYTMEAPTLPAYSKDLREWWGLWWDLSKGDQCDLDLVSFCHVKREAQRG